MKAKKIYETLDFERGREVKNAMDLGIYEKIFLDFLNYSKRHTNINWITY